MGEQQARYTNFSDFYPFYLEEHSNPVCRALHYTGTSLALLLWIYALWTGQYLLLLAGLVVGYGFAWTGHFFFEHNRPATFSHPWYSLVGDFRLFGDMLSGRIRF